MKRRVSCLVGGNQVVAADGEHLVFGDEPVELTYDGDAIFLLMKNADSPA
jgi:hypothetical protein